MTSSAVESMLMPDRWNGFISLRVAPRRRSARSGWHSLEDSWTVYGAPRMRAGLRWRYDLRTHVDAIPVQDESVWILLFGTRFLGLLFLREDSLFFAFLTSFLISNDTLIITTTSGTYASLLIKAGVEFAGSSTSAIGFVSALGHDDCTTPFSPSSFSPLLLWFLEH